DVARNNSRHCDTLTHEELLKYSSEMLVDGGRLAVVLPSVEAKRMVDLSAVYGLVPSRLCIVKSTERKGEIRRLVEFVKTSEWIKCQIEQLCIHSDGDYSDDYKALTKDFYLKF
ncbi:MAG: methyltransferase, partial [Rikenellaceae bacterium]|nr:methyltransferase [Rikenellaceae bacterium]